MCTTLLIACIRNSLGVGSDREVVQTAGNVGDWSDVLDTAESHGLLPLVAACFDSCGAAAPDRVLNALEDAWRRNAKRVLLMSEELNRIYRTLETAGVPVLAVKGPVSASTLYDDPACRIFNDLDLWAPFASVPQVRRILSRCGYEPSGSPKMTVAREAAIARFTEISLENSDNGVHVDLHWELTPKDWYVSLPPDFCERTRMVQVGNCSIRTLGEEETLIHLCVHGAKHGWSSLNWLVDLCSLILRSPGIAGRALRLLPSDSSAAVMVRFGLASAAVICPGISRVEELPEIPAAMRKLAHKVVWQGLSGAARDETILSRLRFQLSLGGNGLALLWFVARRLLTPNQDDWGTLPIRRRGWLFLLVPWRLLRLTWRVVSAPGKVY